MGDMKTPDFDDLLAAFDIPDIDAKEAIQSSPEDEQNEIRSATNERMSGASSCFPCPPATHSDPPVVSVIVKNTVRAESLEDERCVRDARVSPSNCGLNAHVQVKFEHLTSHPGPKVPLLLPGEPQIANGFEESIGEQGQSSTHTWPIHPAGPSSRTSKVETDKGDEFALVRQTADVITCLKPLLYPPTSSSPDLKSSVAPFPSQEPHQEDACRSNPATSLPQNGTMKDVIKPILHSDEDDSEPDLGSPLVIHESPVSIMPSPPKFKRRPKVLLGSPETTPCLVSPPISNFPLLKSAKPAMHCGDKNETATPGSPSIAPLLQSSHSSSEPATNSVLEKKEEYPEHVIEERDSPESPPPSEMGILVPKRSSSPELSQSVNHKDSGHRQELMESELREENRQSEYEHLSESIALKRETFGTDTEGAVPETDSPPLHPLKVKIKMQSGSITKTVGASNPKKSGKNSAKSVDSFKNPPESNTKSKAELQITSTPELHEGTSSVKGAGNETVDKPLVTPTAVNLTRTAALPSISASLPRVSPGSLGLRNLSSAPSHLLQPQNNNKPASIVNSTGAIISKSQTSLVEAFNKILNNRNPLPSYKPDLSTPPPAEWGLPLPAQVNPSSFSLPLLVDINQLSHMF